MAAALEEKAKQFFKSVVANLWAYQSDYPKNKDLTKFDPTKIEAAPSRQLLLWRAFYPVTAEARLRTFGNRTKYVFFLIAAVALYRKDAYLREKEGAPAFARPQRTGLVRLPDGRLAQINPQVDTDLSPAGLWQTFKETFNPLP
jgi:hypothetical protein